MRNTISSKENKSVIYVQTVNTGLAVTGVRAVRKKSEREREVESDGGVKKSSGVGNG